ncbi:hypothetical protein F5884DRAFT_853771 [Xylogone sp. PMI_703]|nr:hypothetical protein F5884DRAFT_853771 [Xylogone sp. PMI_703]
MDGPESAPLLTNAANALQIIIRVSRLKKLSKGEIGLTDLISDVVQQQYDGVTIFELPISVKHCVSKRISKWVVWPKPKNFSLYALWVLRTSQRSDGALRQTVHDLESALFQGSSSVTRIYGQPHPYLSPADDKPDETHHSYVVSLQAVDQTILEKLELSYAERSAVESCLNSRKLAGSRAVFSGSDYLPLKSGTRLVWITLLAIVAALMLSFGLIFRAIHGYTQAQSAKQQEPWVQFPTDASSSGLRYQLTLTSSNVSYWRADHNPDNYTLRLDDQTLIPTAMLTSQEVGVQDWFKARYPHVERVYTSSRYLDAGFLGFATTSEGYLNVDGRFHIAHCVAAIRRYLEAKRSNTHVCPRDLSIGHIDHCLKSLEDFVYKDDVWCHETHGDLEWFTQVCF